MPIFRASEAVDSILQQDTPTLHSLMHMHERKHFGYYVCDPNVIVTYFSSEVVFNDHKISIDSGVPRLFLSCKENGTPYQEIMLSVSPTLLLP